MNYEQNLSLKPGGYNYYRAFDSCYKIYIAWNPYFVTNL
jgi:hypothetical protein